MERKMKILLVLPLILGFAVSSAYADEVGIPGFHYPGYVKSGSGKIRYVHRHANSCAPDLPKAVWGTSSELLGYRCFNPSNGS